MILNLICHDGDGNQVDLYQTPTKVAERCLDAGDWKEILSCYAKYLLTERYEAEWWESSLDMNEAIDSYQRAIDHVRELVTIAAFTGGLSFSYI